MVVHHPSETDEQKWVNVTLPGFFGSLTAISGSMNYASLNTASDSWAPNPYNLSPILFDLRRGIERLDFDANNITNPVDIFASIQTGTQLSASIIHTLGESNGEVYSSVIETNNSTTQFRLYNQSGNLPTHHLAATNHFRLISSPVCCNRYSNIQDSLYSNPFVDAKRQWRVLSGAAGLETTLTAIQFTPSTGMILWSSASLAAPAYLLPALSLNLGDLFSNPVSNSDDYLVAAKAEISLYPNPHSRQQNLYVKSTEELASVELYNIKGQRLNSWTVDSAKGSILLQTDWSSYSRGVYLLKAKTAKGKILSSRMILQ